MKQDLLNLLKELDFLLEKPERIILCGGMAVALAFDGNRQTADIDIIAPVPLSQDLKKSIVQVANQL